MNKDRGWETDTVELQMNKGENGVKKSSLWRSMKRSGLLISVLFFVMTIAVFGPIELYFTNGNELWFSFADLLKVVAILATAALIIPTVVGAVLPKKARSMFACILFAVTLALYIQGNFVNINYGILDGNEVDWSAYPVYAVVDTFGWIVLICGALLLWNKRRKVFRKVQTYAALFVIAIQVLTLGMLSLSTDTLVKEKSSYYLSEEGLYEVSADENMIIFVLDAFDDAYFQELLTDEKEKYESLFEDFTYFDNAAVAAARTRAALPAILTGKPYPGGISYVEYLKEAFNEDQLYSELYNQGYDIRIYTDSIYVPDTAGELVANQDSAGYEVNSYLGLTEKYFKFTLYKYMPHVLKQYFWLYTGDFDQYKQGAARSAYVRDDAKFKEDLSLTLFEDKNAFRLYHLNGAHSPYHLDEYAHEKEETTSLNAQAKGVLYIVEEYIRQMKEVGIYDDATIIIMADHGEVNPDYNNENEAHGILFVKRANEDKDFELSSTPVSYFDLHATIFEQLGIDRGDSFFDIEENTERKRLFYHYTTDAARFVLEEYTIDHNINASDAVQSSGRIFAPTVESKEYMYGTTLTFGVDSTALPYIRAGISGTDEGNYTWTTGDYCLFEFVFEKQPKNDLLVTVDLVSVYTVMGSQQVDVYANGELCHSAILNDEAEFSLVIPSEIIRDDKRLSLKMEFPNAISPVEVYGAGHDVRTLALALKGLTISEEGNVGGIAAVDIEDKLGITDFVAIPLAALMSLCYKLFGNYGLAIIAFTLLTKIILFPVSMWVQRNGIAMVKITPEINRLKIKYYGDKDTIADETQLLYKREKYNPLASTIPMIVQLVMLMGVIGAVKQVMGNADTVLNVLPSEAGGITLLMPLAAGIAALALGLAQNKLNPLQREQGKSEQWMTNGFSIAISLVLGAFVPLGVGIYWICSNLFSIVQQALLNQVIRPEKYIDYEDLARSKEELKAIDSLSSGISKEDKKREKADYKRFFSIANKHIVFYSEKSGFYKYFKDVMEYILRRSNAVIHYVTSDPKDQIFEIAKTQTRIKPYYISENKLITLMMKMDADIVVMTVPDLNKYHLKRSYVRKDIEYIYMFHYPLSTHMVLQTGALDHYDTIFCVGEFQFDEIRAAERVYNLPEKKLIAAGYGQLEQLNTSYQAMPRVRRERPKILIAPSWQEDNILDSCIDSLLEQLLDKGYEVIVRPHPEYVKRYKPRMDQIVERYKGREESGLKFELDFTSNNSIFDSDVLITDWSGTAYEFSFVTLKPAVFIDTKPKINNPEYVKLGIEPLEFTLRSQVGIQVKPDQLECIDKKIDDLLRHGKQYEEKILGIREKYIANFGVSGKIGGRYIISQLKARSKKK